MGELHLEIIKNKLTRDMKVDVDVGAARLLPRGDHRDRRPAPAVCSRSRPAVAASSATAPSTVEPFTAEQAEEAGLKFTDNIAFENKIVGGAIPKEFIPSVEVGSAPPRSPASSPATR
jgi:elongation factor G